MELMNIEQIQGILGQAVQVQGQTTNDVAVMQQTLNQTRNVVSGLSRGFETLSGDVNNIKDEIQRLKLQEEITDEQRENITSNAKSRMCEVLYFNESDIHKYGRVYIANLYTFLKQKHNLGGKIATTKKGNYDNVMNGIQSWYPDHEKLKARVDNR